jgi:DNA-binding NarL/FixJ family response regulator
LNERELAVLIAVCRQFSNEEISQKLDLSVSSIKKYRISLMEKTQSQNSIGLLAYALKNGLIELNDV